jgi:hypothetical protein
LNLLETKHVLAVYQGRALAISDLQ